MYKLITGPAAPPRLAAASRLGLRQLASAWLVSAAALLLGALLALVVGRVHYARGLALLALVLAGWLHAVELAIKRALASAEPSRPTPALDWLPGWYCGFCLTQVLGVMAGYLAWLRIRHG